MRAVLKPIVAASLVALAMAGCSADTTPADPQAADLKAADSKPADGGSVRGLTDLAGRHYDADYTPLASPADAVAKADLIVSGTLTEVGDGIRIENPDPASAGRNDDGWATFVVEVDKVIDGDAAQVRDGKVYIAVRKNSAAATSRLQAANPRAKIVAVLEDWSTWRPDPATTVVRPANVPAAAPLFAAYTDGLWLQGTSDARMLAIAAHAEDLTPAWAGADTVDEFAAALEKAGN